MVGIHSVSFDKDQLSTRVDQTRGDFRCYKQSDNRSDKILRDMEAIIRSVENDLRIPFILPTNDNRRMFDDLLTLIRNLLIKP
jgi:hypothetical protein